MQKILFSRPESVDRIAGEPEPDPIEGVDFPRQPYFPKAEDDQTADLAEPAPGTDLLDLQDQVRDLTDEVDHLRACIDQILDLFEAQSHVADDVDLLFERVGVSDRRIQRVEDAVTDRYDGPRRRAEDEPQPGADE